MPLLSAGGWPCAVRKERETLACTRVVVRERKSPFLFMQSLHPVSLATGPRDPFGSPSRLLHLVTNVVPPDSFTPAAATIFPAFATSRYFCSKECTYTHTGHRHSLSALRRGNVEAAWFEYHSHWILHGSRYGRRRQRVRPESAISWQRLNEEGNIGGLTSIFNVT